MSNLQERKVRFYNEVEILTIDQSSQSSGSVHEANDPGPSPLATTSHHTKQGRSSQPGGHHDAAVSDDDQMDWMEDFQVDDGQIPLPYVPEADIDAPENDDDLDQIPPPPPSATIISARSDADDKIVGGKLTGSVREDIGADVVVLEELDDEQDPPLVPASPNDNLDVLEQLVVEQDPPPVPASPGSSTARLAHERIPSQPRSLPAQESFDTLSLAQVTNLAEDQHDMDSKTDFARAEQWWMCGKFFDLYETFFEPVPSHTVRMEMEHEGLINPGADEEVFCAIYEMKLRCRHTHLHYEFGHDAHLDQHILEAMRRIAYDLEYLAKCRIDLIKEARKAIHLLDAMEASEDPYKALGFRCYCGKEENLAQKSLAEMVTIYLSCRIEAAAVHLLSMPHIADWPKHWFNNLFLDMVRISLLF
ncbi:hypothetical protein PISMIDRAFT_13473 [Pisolithus microcarpus 441]|uniref:Uncharacterized protein n=1 Tax=Pisolithus microcarpus 441 TaxID=765257 RepID=A0A0C9ZB71_9AGAM|nr:hypothetical protein BKA83DRAFT_13473 [Pisolithus microcarpus]KIK19742.1 hypothetical protein PISMIDRAFT_13473 [Pisolithus microcarpus 441]